LETHYDSVLEPEEYREPCADQPFRRMLEASRALTSRHTHDGTVLYISPASVDLLGTPPAQLVGLSIFDLVHPDDEPQMRDGFSSRPANTLVECRLRLAHGSYEWFEALVTVTPEDVICVCREIGQRKELEKLVLQLEDAARLARGDRGLAQLAGSIAHDFNNLLVGIRGYAELALMLMQGPMPVRQPIERIVETADLAAEFTQQILAFAGKGRLVLAPVDLSMLAREMGRSLASGAAPETSFSCEIAPDLPKVEADPIQLHHALLNLLTNAVEAVDRQGGTVTVRTGLRAISWDLLADAVVGQDLPEGSYVALEVEDDGCGISDGLQARIFEPFFTTKPQGRGLGLPAVLGIVRAHGGGVLVRSREGAGSTFTILLPPISNGNHRSRS